MAADEIAGEYCLFSDLHTLTDEGGSPSAWSYVSKHS